MAEWNRLGIRELKIAVNVATPQLLDNRLVKDLKRSIARHAISPSNLIVEFTESILMQSDQGIDATVKGVADTGVSISLDDFGTGFSSLSYLKRLPLSELKIDRSFVMGLPNDKDSVAIVSAVVGLAKNLGLQVTAEGVETEGQLMFLQGLGCHQFQGFLRSKAVAPSDFVTLLR